LVDSLDGDRLIAGSLPTEKNKTQQNVNIHPYLERDWNTCYQCSSGPISYAP